MFSKEHRPLSGAKLFFFAFLFFFPHLEKKSDFISKHNVENSCKCF